MSCVNKNSIDYKDGYKNGYSSGYAACRSSVSNRVLQANWVMRNGDWFCSNCNTKHEQKHDNYCCKCGANMDANEAG